MSNSPLPMAADGGVDDLPRTLRRAREERMREAEMQQQSAQHADTSVPSFAAHAEPRPSFLDDPERVTVTAVKVPFVRLMMFFLKAVFAAIPAIIVLGVLLWLLGAGLKAYFPQLVHMQITISIPR